MPTTPEIVTWLFVATNACRLFAYVPQLLAAARCENGASAVSRATWSYFAVAHLAGHLYSRMVLHDARMASVLLGNFVACSALVGTVTWKKYRYRAGARAARRMAAHVSVPVSACGGQSGSTCC